MQLNSPLLDKGTARPAYTPIAYRVPDHRPFPYSCYQCKSRAMDKCENCQVRICLEHLYSYDGYKFCDVCYKKERKYRWLPLLLFVLSMVMIGSVMVSFFCLG
eukprot:TRINITY_DN12390_c0_g1_i1.p1 TRINITY_DN12390_c0_g1~~TRINITY_DN12390_c0_g1_i1.p1  ORF type:complete len:103 (-),score=2.88 TRINITY_DN12390_c0_g1_i1:56-364(-)